MAIGMRSDIKFTTSIADAEWAAGLDAMYARLEVATGDASLAAADIIRTITQGQLTQRAHSPLTFSNSPPGEPPSEVSGALAASIDTAEDGPFDAIVGPTGLDYARIQELGGNMHGHPYMVFDKVWEGHLHTFYRTFVSLDPRPYLEPATELAVNSGAVRDAYIEHWSAAIEG